MTLHLRSRSFPWMRNEREESGVERETVSESRNLGIFSQYQDTKKMSG